MRVENVLLARGVDLEEVGELLPDLAQLVLALRVVEVGEATAELAVLFEDDRGDVKHVQALPPRG